MQSDVDVLVVSEYFHDQIVSGIDVVADLQQHWEWIGRVKIGGNDLSQTLADRFWYAGGITVPVCKFGWIFQEVFDEFSESIRCVMF